MTIKLYSGDFHLFLVGFGAMLLLNFAAEGNRVWTTIMVLSTAFNVAAFVISRRTP